MESRAAVFTTRPQDVEVYQAGAWWPGSLLGWRHDSTGDCQVWVRVVIGGVEETAWTDLSTLRLPERSAESPLALAPSLSATEQLKVVAGRTPVPAAGDAGSARSLPPVPDGASAAAAPAQRAGGRRRAPEPSTAEFTLPEAPVGVASPGRHRASGGHGPVVPGRHRAADTGMWPAVTDDATGRLAGPVDGGELVASAVPAGGGRRRADRAAAAAGVPAGPWSGRPPVVDAPAGRRSAHRDAEPDLLTRPMRLDDLAGQSRKPRLDGFLSKA
jgi:hypothetical protein